MPSFAPREEPIKKRQELAKRENALLIAIKKNISPDKIERLAGKSQQAQLSLFKAKLHHIQEKEFQKKKTNFNRAKIEKEIVEWTNKTLKELITEMKNKCK